MECRICFENNNLEENPLLSPCRCSGTSKYVHLNCIQTWRRLNINTEYLTKCRECNAKYVINKSALEETFTIDYGLINFMKQKINYLYFNVFSFIISILSRSLDRYTGYSSLFILNIIDEPSKDIISLIKNEEFYSLLFYQSSLILWVSSILIPIFLGFILVKVKDLPNYFNYSCYWLIPSALSLLHFLYFALLSNKELWLFELFLNFEIILSNANLFICLTMFEKHNDSIKIMNDENIGIVENFVHV